MQTISITSLKDARSFAGSLSKPSKMPGTSYGISAHLCKTGGKLSQVPGSVCESCYAKRGQYQFAAVKQAHAQRVANVESPQWVDALVLMIKQACTTHHRWHDSGDLQSLEHLHNIVRVADELPEVRFWLPTKEKGLVNQFMRLFGDFPDNLCVRLSAAMIDGLPPDFPNTSTVITTRRPIGYLCPAPTQGNNCRDCRACWDKRVANVTYHKH